MPDHGAITLYDWILKEFTVEARAEFVNYLGPHLDPLIHPGDRVLDLCCGTGPFAFWLEERGARVTAIDFAPYMIERARQEASERGSTVEFVTADVLEHDLGHARFDLVAFLGNTLSDFSLNRFVRLANRAHHYVDGLHDFIEGGYPKEAIQQEAPYRITRRFKHYLPEEAAYVETYVNEATGETYDYTSYVYAPPVVRLAVAGLFELEYPFPLSERSFLDVFIKRSL
jgi:SAM-dependent methyltransferase